MNPSDYVVFGTARGLFAEGTGWLAQAHLYADQFEFSVPRDAASLIPQKGGTTLVRRPFMEEDRKESFHLYCFLVAATDCFGRPGYLGVGTLVPQDTLDADGMKSVLSHLDDLLGVVRQEYLNRAGAFESTPDPFDRQMNHRHRANQPRKLKATDSGSRIAFRAASPIASNPSVAVACLLLCRLKEDSGKLLQITEDSDSGLTFLDELETARLEARIREKTDHRPPNRGEEDLQELGSEMDRLRAQVYELEETGRKIKEEFYRLEHRMESLGAIRPHGDGGGDDAVFHEDGFDAATHSRDRAELSGLAEERRALRVAINQEALDGNLPGFGRSRKQSKSMLAVWAAIGTAFALIAVLVVWIALGTPVVSPSATTALPEPGEDLADLSPDIKMDCTEFAEILETSTLTGETPSDWAGELRSCIRAGFQGLSSSQADCSRQDFRQIAEAFWPAGIPGEAVTELSKKISQCFDE